MSLPISDCLLKLRHLAGNLGLLIVLLMAHGLVDAQGYPTKTIRMVIGFSPGGLTDNLARIIAPAMSEALGHKVYVDNRPGSAGIIAADIVAKSPPDGYTVLLTDQALINNPGLYAKLPYDTLKEFQAISLVGAASFVLVVHPSLPVRSAKEFAAFAKARPGDITYGSGGSGSISHLAAPVFEQVAGIKLVHIPYKGMGPALVGLLGGHVSLSFSSIGPAVPFVNDGRLRAIAVTGPAPVAVLPRVPTLAASGYPAATVVGYWGMVAPAGIARDTLAKLSDTVVATIKRPDVAQRIIDQGVDPSATGHADYQVLIRDEMARWAKIIKQAGIKVD